MTVVSIFSSNCKKANKCISIPFKERSLLVLMLEKNGEMKPGLFNASNTVHIVCVSSVCVKKQRGFPWLQVWCLDAECWFYNGSKHLFCVVKCLLQVWFCTCA